MELLCGCQVARLAHTLTRLLKAPPQRCVAKRCVTTMATDSMPNATVLDERVQALREEMKKAGMDAYIVPSEDAHMVGCYELT